MTYDDSPDFAETREALYKALCLGASPHIETVAKVCQVFGVRLLAQPMHAA